MAASQADFWVLSIALLPAAGEWLKQGMPARTPQQILFMHVCFHLPLVHNSLNIVSILNHTTCIFANISSSQDHRQTDWSWVIKFCLLYEVYCMNQLPYNPPWFLFSSKNKWKTGFGVNKQSQKLISWLFRKLMHILLSWANSLHS